MISATSSVNVSYDPQLEAALFMRKVYAFMSAGLGVTALTAWLVANSVTMQQLIFGNRLVFYGLLFAELGMVVVFSSMVRKMSASNAAILLFCYAIVNGMTLSIIFLLYTHASIFTTFLVTSATFGTMSIYGFFTHRDLTSFGNILMMGLVGVIIASVVNIFTHSPALYWAVTYLGVFVFTGLTAYDTQKIKDMNTLGGNGGPGEDTKLALSGALMLYLDFVNLFLLLLRLFGRRR
ncbi:MAG: Bax inhibitor-1/YccA family protein [Polyangia bacterium]